MSEFRTAAREFTDGNATAAGAESLSATDSYIQAVNLLSDTSPSQFSFGCFQQYSPQEYQRMLAQAESAVCADQQAAAGLAVDCP
jgi:hypothetical protein